MQTIPSADVSAVEASIDHAAAARRILSARSSYKPHCDDVRYTDAELAIARKLALENFGELSHIPIREWDRNFHSEGCTQVARYVFKDGSAGYFKPFSDNSYSEGDFRDFGTTSLGGSINDVNAYRMAQLLGGRFAELVPETVLREIEGSLGSLQREVIAANQPKTSYHRNPQLREDYRKAAIFDFTIGNMDRHSGNFLYTLEAGPSGRRRYRMRLIDNSFSFPWKRNTAYFNQSIFAENNAPGGFFDSDGYHVPQRELELKPDERAALAQARVGVEGWISAGTISRRRGQSVLRRMNFLLESNSLGSLSEYIFNRPY